MAFVPADRLTGWVERFAAAHQGIDVTEDTDDGVRLRLHDGSVALLAPPWPDDGRPGRGTDLLARLASVGVQERRLGLVLIRRGGYAVGVAVAGKLVVHKVGTVSSRSRGADQAWAITQRTAQEAAKIFSGENFEYMGPGGDKALVEAVLASPLLRSHRNRPQLGALAVADPNMAVLQRAAVDFCAIRVQITEHQSTEHQSPATR